MKWRKGKKRKGERAKEREWERKGERIYQEQKLISHSFSHWKVQDQGIDRFSVWRELFSGSKMVLLLHPLRGRMLCPHVVDEVEEGGGRGDRFPPPSLIRASNPINDSVISLRPYFFVLLPGRSGFNMNRGDNLTQHKHSDLSNIYTIEKLF